MHLANLVFRDTISIPVAVRLWPPLVMGIIAGIIYGVALGLIDYFFDKEFFRDKPLGKIILLKSFFSLVILLLVYALIRYVLFSLIARSTLPQNITSVSDSSWRHFLVLILVYCFFMTLIINFIIQVNKKFGPGVLVPMLFGKYRNPKEEERIFLFMDLQSSTTIAEKLGHIKYSSFIRDSFIDINKVLKSYDAEVYQYVGDEIVISWKVDNLLKKTACVEFFFASQEQFENRSSYYLDNYGTIPVFKAGMHIGKVTAVEIGELKRDIAYHGDTLNTAARIQSMCNQYGKKLLVSSHLTAFSAIDDRYATLHLGEILLRGKSVPVGILSIERAV